MMVYPKIPTPHQKLNIKLHLLLGIGAPFEVAPFQVYALNPPLPPMPKEMLQLMF
jgi:hypothetical protein